MIKRNTFLGIGSDEEDDVVASDVEESRDSRFSKFQAKRRKLSQSDHSDTDGELLKTEAEADHDVENEAHSGSEIIVIKNKSEYKADGTATGDWSVNAEQQADTVAATELEERHSEDELSKKSRRKILNKVKLEKAQQKIQKTGVIYISRIPPFMKPSTLRQLMAPYGMVLRIFLTPEPAPKYAARVKAGGNRKKSYVDGWVEFESKQRAKLCAEMLNGNIVGGKKGGFYHDDIWNIKYLRGFKWNDLMEQVSGEQREREGRLQAEIERERRERKIFLRNFERAKIERGMESKRARKALARGEQVITADDDGDEYNVQESGERFGGKRPKMKFKQNMVRSNNPEETKEKVAPRALSKIFG